MSDELKCWNCGESLADVPRPISRHEQCRQCFEALHCCRLCHHYRTGITGDCDEERADPPVIKENANFCDWFRPRAGAYSASTTDKSEAAKDRLSALFGDSKDGDSENGDNANSGASEEDSAKRPQTAGETARSKLDDLFSNE